MNKEVRNCVVIHGCPSRAEKDMDAKTRTYDKHWILWIKNELTARGITVETPLMPDPWDPVYESYKKTFEKNSIAANTILVGHSCGCAFLVRWLGDTKQEIDKLILVAPWKVPDYKDELKKAFYRYHVDETIKQRVNNIVMFTSNNERESGKRSLQIFHRALGGEIIDLPNHGHYSPDSMDKPEFPELLEVILR